MASAAAAAATSTSTLAPAFSFDSTRRQRQWQRQRQEERVSCRFAPPGRCLQLVGIIVTISLCRAAIAQEVVSSSPLYCLAANETCYSDTTCYPLLSSVAKWCGNYTAGRCTWVKEQHCVSILRTLKNRAPFKDCHCRQEQFDHAELQRCRQVHRFVQNHPCLELASPAPTRIDLVNEADDTDEDAGATDAASVTSKTTEQNSTGSSFCDEAYDSQPSCVDVRRQCSSQQVCSGFLDQFRDFCKARGDKCITAPQDMFRCGEVFGELMRHASGFFSCRCDDLSTLSNFDKSQRCEKLARAFKLNPCVQQMIPKCKSRTDAEANANVDLAERPRIAVVTKRPEIVSANTPPVMRTARKDGIDCFDAVTECYNNDTCRAKLGSMVHACRYAVQPRLKDARAISIPLALSFSTASASLTERCELNDCLSAVSEFYTVIGKKHAHAAAFCSCPHPQSPDYPNCAKHLEYLRPPCAFAQQPTPTCFELLRGCYERNSAVCRETMKIFHVDCKPNLSANRSSNDSCALGVQKCRQALMRMIPRGLITDSCTCDGTLNNTREVCTEIHDRLFNNPCVSDALSILHGPKGKGLLGFSVQHELSRPAFSQLPTGYNESVADANTCARLQRFSRVSDSQYRIYQQYQMVASSSSGCSEIVRCENQVVSRLPADRWCNADEVRLAVNLSHQSFNHSAFLRPLMLLCSNNTSQSSFVIYSSVSQYCVCHFSELVCANVAHNSPAQSGSLLLHAGYSVSEMQILQSKIDEVDFDVIADKLTKLVSTPVKQCAVQVLWENEGQIQFKISATNQDDEAVDNEAYCSSAAKLAAHFINQRHPFISHEPELSLLRSAVVEDGGNAQFLNDVSSFKRYLQRLSDPSSDKDDSMLLTGDLKLSKKDSAFRRKEARSRDEYIASHSSSNTTASLVNCVLLMIICFFRRECFLH